MTRPRTSRRLTAGLALVSVLIVVALAVSMPAADKAAEPAKVAGKSIRKTVDYDRQIKPLLSDRCYACHGPDASARQADLRLDVREVAVDYGAIVPGSAKESLIIERVTAEDPDMRMPPPSSKKKPLTADDIATLRRWLDEGAKYEAHWAYVKPVRPPVPEVRNKDWPLGPIDHFIAAGHEAQGLEPSPEADRRTLIRRLSFDLTGLPPTAAEVKAFAEDKSPDAYEKVVDRLLASPHYGERMAVYWLDVARYADTGGYHSDNHRDVWLYRDYVIRAFNENKPFDQFTREQLAGDLQPDATRWQRIASGYNRLLQTTEEGGAQPKEYQAKYDADRVRNTATAWMGATMGCCQCHDHKFDPYTQKDFYSFAAFFADIKERSVGRQEQTEMPTPEQEAELKRLDEQIAPLRKLLAEKTPKLDAGHKDLPKEIADILAVEAKKRSAGQNKKLDEHIRSITPELEPSRKKLADLEAKRMALDDSIPTTLVSQSVNPRTIRVLPRGNWLDDSGEVVTPAIPKFLGKLDTGDRRATRLDLADWLVSPENPMVARVLVNRLWSLFFGRGIVPSLDDFGAQGSVPSHPELLDWLAVEFVESGWDVKHIVRLMVTSRTYRQSSAASDELRRRDPENVWLARQGRFRIEAEFVRDNALAISGLLASKIGGPSVKPYQPAGYWQHLNFPKRTWVHDKGENEYRRGLYTYWQRTFLHPSLLAFDASTRENCTVARVRSNTPLQALALLNDPTYVEAARVFAQRIVAEGGKAAKDRIRFAMREALDREPTDAEAKVLGELYRKHSEHYAQDKAAAKELLAVGDPKPPEGVDPADLAAWTSVARVVLDLHETITRY